MMDLVSSQYGWGDEYILNLPYQRLAQIVDAISERQRGELERIHSYVQMFYTPVWGLATGQTIQLPDLFTPVKDAFAQPTEQFRTDEWWKTPSSSN